MSMKSPNPNRLSADTLVAVVIAGSFLLAIVSFGLGLIIANLSTPFSIAGVVFAVVGILFYLVVDAGLYDPEFGYSWCRNRPKNDLLGKTAEVRTADQVFVNGALWRVECDQSLDIGTRVEIIAVNGLTLVVKVISRPGSER